MFFTQQSDDDCWVFIGGRLVVDLGGGHFYWSVGGDYSLADLKTAVQFRDPTDTSFLAANTGTCRIDIFYADREEPTAALIMQSNSALHPIFVYQVVAETDLPTTLTYSLSQHPMGMCIDEKTGKITWDYHALNSDADPGNDVAAGRHLVTIIVSDARGYSTSQSITLTLSL